MKTGNRLFSTKISKSLILKPKQYSNKEKKIISYLISIKSSIIYNSLQSNLKKLMLTSEKN